jgi:hypothetical protein
MGGCRALRIGDVLALPPPTVVLLLLANPARTCHISTDPIPDTASFYLTGSMFFENTIS